VSEETRRGLLPGLAAARPLAERLPGVLQDDPFTTRFTTAFDDAYAPVLTTLDSLACYVDPWLAPTDFLDWLATWVGVELDDAWSVDQRRRIIADAARVHRQRGTAAGIEASLEASLGADVEVTDTGGCTWSEKPGADPGGSSPPGVSIRIRVADPDAVDQRRVTALLEDVVPAHVQPRYRIDPLDQRDQPEQPEQPEQPDQDADGDTEEDA
jgi:phage tail-like protein